MLAPSSGLLRAGLALKLNQIKLATRSYLRDRTNQATAPPPPMRSPPGCSPPPAFS